MRPKPPLPLGVLASPMRCTPSLSEQLWRVRTNSGHETSCSLVEECGEFDLQLFDANGKMFFGCRFPDRAGALALSEALRRDFTHADAS